MTEKVRLKKAFGDTLEKHQFRKKGQSWYLHGSESIVVLNLQKDDFSDLYYVNFGVWLLVFGNNEYPPENHCHVGARLEELFPAQRELIFDACTIDPEESQLPRFIEFLQADVVPLCRRCLSIAGLKDVISSGQIPHYYVVRIARPHLGLPERE